jgi:hypothetical protein
MSDWKSKATSLMSRFARVKEAAEKATETVIQTAEVAGCAFGLAYLRGRYPSKITKADGTVEQTKDLLVAGIPVSLLVGIGGHVAGFAGLMGKYDEHAHNIASGALAEYAAQKAAEIGQKHKEDADKPKDSFGEPVVQGSFGPGNFNSGYNQQDWGYAQQGAFNYAAPMGRQL